MISVVRIRKIKKPKSDDTDHHAEYLIEKNKRKFEWSNMRAEEGKKEELNILKAFTKQEIELNS